jgi:hypothetical protein
MPFKQPLPYPAFIKLAKDRYFRWNRIDVALGVTAVIARYAMITFGFEA